MKLSKQARRERAAARFTILPMISWSKSRGGMGHIDVARPYYVAYVERKNIERQALNIT